MKKRVAVIFVLFVLSFASFSFAQTSVLPAWTCPNCNQKMKQGTNFCSRCRRGNPNSLIQINHLNLKTGEVIETEQKVVTEGNEYSIQPLDQPGIALINDPVIVKVDSEGNVNFRQVYYLYGPKQEMTVYWKDIDDESTILFSKVYDVTYSRPIIASRSDCGYQGFEWYEPVGTDEYVLYIPEQTDGKIASQNATFYYKTSISYCYSCSGTVEAGDYYCPECGQELQLKDKGQPIE